MATRLQNFLPYILAAFAFLCITMTVTNNPTKNPSFQRVFIAPPEGIKHLHFGYNEIIADMLWIRAIQDFEYCDSHAGTCSQNTWLFKMLETTLALSPNFRMVAVTGGVTLSVLISDIEGASKFFDIAIRNYPRDWQVLYYAAYHAIYEEKNKAKAAGLLQEAAKYGGPDWLNNLAVRLYTDAGQKELALGLYHSIKNSGLPDGYIKRMEEKLGIPPVEK